MNFHGATGTPTNYHEKLQQKVLTMTDESLRFVARDAYQAAEFGYQMGNPKAGYYMDEYHYCTMELQRRATN